MKKKILSLIVVAAMAVSFSLTITKAASRVVGSSISSITLNDQDQKKDAPAPKDTKAVKETYTCPMHPEVVKDKPGKCPKCGMALVKKEAPKTVYTCPMHPEVVKDKKGKCPKCGMDLVEKTPAKKDVPKKN
jgi:hypothetical protein